MFRRKINFTLTIDQTFRDGTPVPNRSRLCEKSTEASSLRKRGSKLCEHKLDSRRVESSTHFRGNDKTGGIGFYTVSIRPGRNKFDIFWHSRFIVIVQPILKNPPCSVLPQRRSGSLRAARELESPFGGIYRGRNSRIDLVRRWSDFSRRKTGITSFKVQSWAELHQSLQPDHDDSLFHSPNEFRLP